MQESAADNQHTILLVQFNERDESRTWEDYTSRTDCLDGICGLFERRLKKDNPHTRKLTYDIKDLFDYVDRLRDISCLIYDKNHRIYEPKGRDWVKRAVFEHLKGQAGTTN